MTLVPPVREPDGPTRFGRGPNHDQETESTATKEIDSSGFSRDCGTGKENQRERKLGDPWAKASRKRRRPGENREIRQHNILTEHYSETGIHRCLLFLLEKRTLVSHDR
jgi:hypothetical protein